MSSEAERGVEADRSFALVPACEFEVEEPLGTCFYDQVVHEHVAQSLAALIVAHDDVVDVAVAPFELSDGHERCHGDDVPSTLLADHEYAVRCDGHANVLWRCRGLSWRELVVEGDDGGDVIITKGIWIEQFRGHEAPFFKVPESADLNRLI